MKKQAKVHHFVIYNYQGKPMQSGLVVPYRLTVSALVRRFFQVAIDEGFNLAKITEIEFLVDGRTVLGASDGNMLRPPSPLAAKSQRSIPIAKREKLS